MNEYKVTCPACLSTITSDNERELILMVHAHAHGEHDKHLSEDQIREMIETE